MTSQDMASRVADLLSPKAEAAGLELVAVEVAGSTRTPLVRVYLDRPGGIDIDAIAEANPWVTAALDTMPEMERGYDLEVSSPGIERPLVTAEHFERYTGSKAKISTREPIDGRKSFTGVIVGLESDDVLLDVDGTTYKIPLGAIDKARLRVEIDFNKEGLDGI